MADRVIEVHTRDRVIGVEVRPKARVYEVITGKSGLPGIPIELGTSATHLQWRYVGTVPWWDIIALADLEGAAGADGSDGADGAKGDQGDPGADGREVEIRSDGTNIQWRYVGEASWTNVVALAALKGDQGEKGDTGDPGPKGDQGDPGPPGEGTTPPNADQSTVGVSRFATQPETAEGATFGGGATDLGVSPQTLGLFVDSYLVRLAQYTTKGDLLSRSGSVVGRVPVGANGTVLTADSTQTRGMRWAPPAVSDAAVAALIDDTDSETRLALDALYEGGGGGGASPPEVRSDPTPTHLYMGTAPDGTAEGSTGWTITRTTLTSPPAFHTALGAWDDRAGLTYS